MKIIKILNKIGYVLIVILLLVVSVVKMPNLLGWQTYAILSGSMEPEIPTGSVVYVQKVDWEELIPGDCITFRLGTDTHLTATHRIVFIDRETRQITTKGDANSSEDVMKVRESSLIGKVVYTLPVLGYGAWFLSTMAGKVYCVVAFLLVLLPKEKRSKKKNKKVLLNVLVIIILLVMFLLAWELAKVMMGYVQSRREYGEIRNAAVISMSTQEPLVNTNIEGADGTADRNPEFSAGVANKGESAEAEPVCPIAVEFETLWETNKDIVGWVYLESLDISYPIVQAQDNDKYLHTSVKGTYNSAGSIFIDAWNHADFEDPHTIVYGHNMRNGTMFGSLKKLSKQQAVEQMIEDTGQAPVFWIITPQEQYRYEIFSIHAVAAGGDTYALFSLADETYVEFVNRMAKESEVTLPQREYSRVDRMVTLSTCTGNDAYRLVVQGIRSGDGLEY